MLQSESIDMETVSSTMWSFLDPYCIAADFIASADDAAMVEAYVVNMVVLQDAKKEDNDNNDIDPSLAMTMTWTCRQCPTSRVLHASFQTVHHDKETCQFMVAEQEAMLAAQAAGARREEARSLEEATT
jgi:hypothetical protein